MKTSPKDALERLGLMSSDMEEMGIEVLEKLKLELELSEEDLYRLVDIPPSTVSNRKTLTSDEARRVYRAAHALSLAEHVLGTHERAVQWLKVNAVFLGNRKPIELLETETGAKAVRNLLYRIEYSVYS